MERKKSILFLLLILLCFVVVGCGKEKTEDTKKEEKTSSVQTLKCSNEDGDTKVSMTIEQNKKTYEITKAQMTMSAKSDLYEDMGLTDEQLKSAICNEDLGAYKSCNVKNSDGTITVDYEFDLEEFKKETLEDTEKDELDGETLKKLKESAEEEGYTCKIS